MAVTHVKNRLEVVVHDATMLELISREWPEGASQTFLAGAPLKIPVGTGLATKFVNPTDGLLAGWALSDGHNTTGASVTVVPAYPHIEIEANFLGAAAADNVLAATDLGKPFDLLESATLIGGDTAGWYISDATADPSVRISSFPPIRVANEAQKRTAAGDTNARVRATPIRTKTHWNTT